MWSFYGVFYILISTTELTLKVLSRSVWDRWYTCVLMLLVLPIVCESYRFATYQMYLPLCPQSSTWSRLFNCSLADNFLILSLGAASVWRTIWGVFGWWNHPCMCKTAKHLDPVQKTLDARVNKNHLWLSHKNRCPLLPSQVQIQGLLGSMLAFEITMIK